MAATPPSQQPLMRRLQVTGTRRLAVAHAPATIDAALGVPPETRAPLEEAEVALLFTGDLGALTTALPMILPVLRPDAILWVAYPKLTSAFARDLNRDIIRALAPDYGLTTVSQIAIDADWSALRLKRVG